MNMNLDIGSDNMENVDEVVENILKEVDNGKVAVIKIPIDKFIDFDKKESPDYWKDGKGFVFYNYVKYAFVIVKKISSHSGEEYEIIVELPTGAKNFYHEFTEETAPVNDRNSFSFKISLKNLRSFVEIGENVEFYNEFQHKKILKKIY